jgi:SPOR domain
VSPERDDSTEDQDLYEDIPPRSIFAATWFRVVLILIVLGVIGAVAVPYILDWMNPPPVSRSASVKATSPVPPATPISPLPASESAAPSRAEKTDVAPAPTPAAPPAAARPEPKPEPKPAPVAKAPAPKSETKSESSAKTESTPKAAAPAKTESAKAETAPKSQVVAKAEPAAKDEAKRIAAKAPASAATPTAGGPFWVQVGAYKDPDTAKRVATALRDQNYKVEQTDTQVSAKAAAAAAASSSTAPSPAASPGDLYDVHVSGMSAVELTKRLSAKGLAAETAGGTVVVKPSLPLRDAVTLSKDLAVDGLKVQVRRAGSGPTPSTPATPPPATASAGETLHRVRVGAFTDVAEARAAAKELEAKGYKPYIARGNE